jgi:hypothetical protein
MIWAAFLVLLAMPALACAASYYVSPSGSDFAAGTSPSTAWRTVARVNSAALVAGDTVLFQGGESR